MAAMAMAACRTILSRRELDRRGSVIRYAASNGRVGELRATLEAGVGRAIDQPDAAGMTALMHASASGRTICADVLLEHGADPNAASDGRPSALCLAARRGDFGTCKRLLAAGADVEYVMRSPSEVAGLTALALAEIAGHVAIAGLLEMELRALHRFGKHITDCTDAEAVTLRETDASPAKASPAKASPAKASPASKADPVMMVSPSQASPTVGSPARKRTNTPARIAQRRSAKSAPGSPSLLPRPMTAQTLPMSRCAMPTAGAMAGLRVGENWLSPDLRRVGEGVWVEEAAPAEARAARPQPRRGPVLAAAAPTWPVTKRTMTATARKCEGTCWVAAESRAEAARAGPGSIGEVSPPPRSRLALSPPAQRRAQHDGATRSAPGRNTCGGQGGIMRHITSPFTPATRPKTAPAPRSARPPTLRASATARPSPHLGVNARRKAGKSRPTPPKSPTPARAALLDGTRTAPAAMRGACATASRAFVPSQPAEMCLRQKADLIGEALGTASISIADTLAEATMLVYGDATHFPEDVSLAERADQLLGELGIISLSPPRSPVVRSPHAQGRSPTREECASRARACLSPEARKCASELGGPSPAAAAARGGRSALRGWATSRLRELLEENVEGEAGAGLGEVTDAAAGTLLELSLRMGDGRAMAEYIVGFVGAHAAPFAAELAAARRHGLI